MHCDTGSIERFDNENDLRQAQEEMRRSFNREMLELSEEQFGELKPMTRRLRKNTMRNKPCPCGSNMKFKRCCWGKYI